VAELFGRAPYPFRESNSGLPARTDLALPARVYICHSGFVSAVNWRFKSVRHETRVLYWSSLLTQLRNFLEFTRTCWFFVDVTSILIILRSPLYAFVT
jgi:hypothetical protein